MHKLQRLVVSLPKRRSPIITMVAFLLLAGLYSLALPKQAQAAALTSVKATLSTSSPSAEANWTIQFVNPTLVNESDTIVLDFDTIATTDEFNLTGVAEAAGASDLDLAEDTDGSPASCSGTLTEETLDPSAGATAWGVAVNDTTDTITFTAPSNAATYIAAGACVVIKIGQNAASEFAGSNQINNTAGSGTPGTAKVSDLAISFTGNAAANSGTALVAVVEGVTVSVTIDESMSVVLAEVAAASCPATLPGTDKSDDASHTDTAIAFGTLSAGNAFNHSCHQVTVSTNATGGYSTTVEKSQLLTSGGDTIADGTCDGACSTTASATWTTTTNNGFGYCMDDVTGDAAATADGTEWTTAQQCDDATPEFKLYGTANTNAKAIMASAGPVSGDNSIIGTVLNYAGSQAAGTYTTTLTFISTPTF